MTTEDDFLRAICAQPDDDTLRLVYADWLDEQDRSAYPLAASLARYIRASIRIAQGAPVMPRGRCGRAERSRRLEERERQQKEYLAALQETPKFWSEVRQTVTRKGLRSVDSWAWITNDSHWERGLPSKWSGLSGAWLREGRKLARYPLKSVDLFDLKPFLRSWAREGSLKIGPSSQSVLPYHGWVSCQVPTEIFDHLKLAGPGINAIIYLSDQEAVSDLRRAALEWARAPKSEVADATAQG